jgi:transcription elongation factor Elf1
LVNKVEITIARKRQYMEPGWREFRCPTCRSLLFVFRQVEDPRELVRVRCRSCKVVVSCALTDMMGTI